MTKLNPILMNTKTDKTNNIKYLVCPEKRIVVCLLSDCQDIACNKINKYTDGAFFWSDFKIKDTYRGIAKCDPRDTFDVEYGKKLALERAKKKRAKAVNKALDKYIETLMETIHRVANFGYIKEREIDG